MAAQAFDTFAVLQILAQALPVTLGIALLGYLALRKRELPRPVGLAMLSIGLLLVNHVANTTAMVLLPSYLTVDALPLAFSVASLISAVVHAVSIFMLIMAIFLDRTTDNQSTYRDIDVGGTPLSNQPSENPYAGPRQ